ncbi:hypothetical protein BGY98DRAFT_1013479, partial [Russula aff. rugulosa BPL654]
MTSNFNTSLLPILRAYLPRLAGQFPRPSPGPGTHVHEAVLVFSTILHHTLSLSTNKPPHSCRPY